MPAEFIATIQQVSPEFTAREGSSIDVSVTRDAGEHRATGTATLHGMSIEAAQSSELVNVAKGRAWLAIATELSDPAAAYEVALRGLEELGTDYRSVERNGKHIIDDSGQNVLLAKMSADKGDHAAAAAEAIKVLRDRLAIYLRVSEGVVE